MGPASVTRCLISRPILRENRVAMHSLMRDVAGVANRRARRLPGNAGCECTNDISGYLTGAYTDGNLHGFAAQPTSVTGIVDAFKAMTTGQFTPPFDVMDLFSQ